MQFDDAIAIDNLVWTMRQADWSRGVKRAMIGELFDGWPPFDDDYQNEFPNNSNFNDLSAPKLHGDARRQFYKAFFETDPYFTITSEWGPPHKRDAWGDRFTKGINRRMRDNRRFLESRKNIFSSAILHAVGVGIWNDDQRWAHNALGVEDVFLPGGTLRSLEDLPYIAIVRRYTGEQLRQMIRGPHVDRAWNVPLVERCIQWVDDEAAKLNGSTFGDFWSPDRRQKRLKEGAGAYFADIAPTVDCIDFLYNSDEGNEEGWRRRIILDSFGTPATAALTGAKPPSSPDYKVPDSRGQFLYNSETRKYANRLDNFVHFQFADAYTGSPARYHTVVGLGKLLYSICHIQNRIRCRLTDAAIEASIQYLRADNPADEERAGKFELVDKSVMPKGISFVRQEERWTVPSPLIQLVTSMNRQTMSDMASGLVQDFQESGDRETAARVNERMSASQAMLSGMLSEGYDLERYRFMEICRRFCIPDSRDGDVMSFRAECLRDGIPPEALDVSRWNIQPVRTVGAGNKAMQMAIMDKVMALYYPLLDPPAQTMIKRIGLAVTLDNFDLAQRLVPDQPAVSNSVHDAELAFGTMMQGVPMSLKDGVNHEEYAQTLLKLMGAVVTRIMQTGGVGTPVELLGLQIVAGQSVEGQPVEGNGVEAHLAIVEQDKSAVAKVKEYRDALGQLLNQVKAFAQRQAEQKNAGNGADAPNPMDAAKAKAVVMHQDTKDRMAMRSHALKTAQKQVQFSQKMTQDQQKHALEMSRKVVESKTNQSVAGNRLAGLSEKG